MPDSSSLELGASARPWLVVCDFDGTIAQSDVTDALLSRFAPPEWELIEAEWKAGAISSKECMSRQIAMMRASEAELDAAIDAVQIDPAFADFVQDCRQQGADLIVVSDGLDYAIKRILRREGLGDLAIFSNRLLRVSEDRYRLEFPHSSALCRMRSGTCKCSLSEALANRRRRLLIGDGSSDFCLAGEADLVFAKDKLLASCIQRELPHRPWSGFSEVRRQFAALLADTRAALPAT